MVSSSISTSSNALLTAKSNVGTLDTARSSSCRVGNTACAVTVGATAAAVVAAAKVGVKEDDSFLLVLVLKHSTEHRTSSSAFFLQCDCMRECFEHSYAH